MRLGVIYQGRRGDAATLYAKSSGERRNLKMYGVLCDPNASSTSTSTGKEIQQETYLSSSQYLWRAELIQRMTAQLQTKQDQVGLLDDMGPSAVAYQIFCIY